MNKENASLLGLVGGVLVVYLAFRTKQYYWDGVTFAYAIETATDWTQLLHPNHLIYSVMGSWFYRLCLWLRPGTRAMDALQILNGSFGAVTVGSVFALLRRVSSLYLSFCLAALFAFSATWWKFTTDADAYIPSIFFLCSTCLMLTGQCTYRALIAGLLYAVSLCLHELAALAMPALIFVAAANSYTRASSRRFRDPVVFAVTSIAITVAIYWSAFMQLTGSADPFDLIRWATSFDPDAQISFGIVDDLLYAVRGTVRLFFGGRINLLRGLLTPATWMVIGLFACTCLALLVQTLRVFLRRGGSRAVNKPFEGSISLAAAVVWICVYICFFFFWSPQNAFYRLFYLVPIVLILGTWLARGIRSPRSYRLILAVSAVALSNFLFLIYPYSHAAKYPPVAHAIEMGSRWPAGTVIYYGTDSSDVNLFRYMNKDTIWRKAKGRGPQEIIDELMSMRGEVWLDATAIDALSSTEQGSEWLRTHEVEGSRYGINDPAYNIKFTRVVC